MRRTAILLGILAFGLVPLTAGAAPQTASATGAAAPAPNAPAAGLDGPAAPDLPVTVARDETGRVTVRAGRRSVLRTGTAGGE